METILAVFGLVALCVACVGTGMYIMGAREVPTVTIETARRRRQPEGLRVTAVSEGMRRIRFIADPMTARYIESLGMGRVFMFYHDQYSGDRHYDLSVSALSDWGEVLAAMGLHSGAVDAPRIASPAKAGAIVKHQGWGQ